MVSGVLTLSRTGPIQTRDWFRLGRLSTLQAFCCSSFRWCLPSGIGFALAQVARCDVRLFAGLQSGTGGSHSLRLGWCGRLALVAGLVITVAVIQAWWTWYCTGLRLVFTRQLVTWGPGGVPSRTSQPGRHHCSDAAVVYRLLASRVEYWEPPAGIVITRSSLCTGPGVVYNVHSRDGEVRHGPNQW